MATRPGTWIRDPIYFALAAAAAGVCIGLAAFLTARYGPSGSNWSFRGNGALAVYAAVPAVLAAGWTAVVLRTRLQPLWAPASLGAGVVGLTLAVLDALLLPVLGSRADQTIGGAALLATAGWALVAPLLAFTLSIRPAARARVSVAAAWGQAAATVIGLAVGLAAATIALPPGS